MVEGDKGSAVTKPIERPRWLSNLRQLWQEPRFRDDGDYADAVEWYNTIELQDFDYDLTLEVARSKYAEVTDAVCSLDDKADSMFRFSATVAGVVIAGTKLVDVGRFPSFFVVAALVMLGLSIILTLRARRTVEKDAPMAIPGLFSLIENSDQMKGRLAAGLHCNIAAIRCVLNWKSRLFDYASNLAIAGLALLLVAVVVSACSPTAVSNGTDQTGRAANANPS